MSSILKTMERISFVVHGGRVQGVRFRYFTREKANGLGITGWCRNTPDNKVEGEAQGAKESLNQFFRHLDEGPAYARVVQLTTEGRDIVDGEEGFEVRR